MLRPLVLFAVALSLSPAMIHAQWIPTIVQDGSIPARGTVRLGVSAELSSFDQRFSRAGDGSLEPLGADFSGAPLGVEQLPLVQGLEEHIAALAGFTGFDLSFGTLDVQLRGRVERLPITAEVGILRRLAFTATVPVVRTRTTVIIGPELGAGGTVGVNPGFFSDAARNHNAAIDDAFRSAEAQLRSRLDECAGSVAPECEPINQDRAAAEAFVATATAFRTSFVRVYTVGFGVPIASTAADAAIVARIAAMRTQFNSYGVTALNSAPARPVAATPLTHGELQQLITGPLIGGDSLATIERVSVGDIELGGKFVVFDGTQPDPRLPAPDLGLRLSLGALVRLPTGNTDRPRNFVDIAPGDGQTDIEGHAFADATFGRRAAISVAARYTHQLPYDATIRIPDYPGQPFPLPLQERGVRRDPGNIVRIEATPRVALKEFFSVGGYYGLHRRTADRSTLLVPEPADAESLVDVSVLDVGTATTEHRLGFGVGWANVAAYRRGRARFPYEISYLHMQTRRARGGPVPALREDLVQVRLWLPLVFWR